MSGNTGKIGKRDPKVIVTDSTALIGLDQIGQLGFYQEILL